jgi:hypothetical protein
VYSQNEHTGHSTRAVNLVNGKKRLGRLTAVRGKTGDRSWWTGASETNPVLATRYSRQKKKNVGRNSVGAHAGTKKVGHEGSDRALAAGETASQRQISSCGEYSAGQKKYKKKRSHRAAEQTSPVPLCAGLKAE